MHALTGYCDRWSVRAGEKIRFMVASNGDQPFDLSFHRIFCADPNPDGPGYRALKIPSPIDGRHQGSARAAFPGSYGEAAITLPAGALALGATVFPTAPGRGAQTVLSLTVGTLHIALGLDAAGRAEARAGQAIVTGRRLPPRAWCDLVLTLAEGVLALAMRPRIPRPAFSASLSGAPRPAGGVARVMVAAEPSAGAAPRAGHFNGKIERPMIWADIGAEAALAAQQAADPPAAGASGLVAGWDFCRDIPRQSVPGIGATPALGLANLPTRAVGGARWNGTVHDWKVAPAHYGAIHFHDDDIGDLGWPESFALDVPGNWPSGLYAAEMLGAHGRDMIPFFVRPAAGAATADTAVLIPTFTYQVYSCFVRPGRGAEIAARAAAWGALPETPDMNPQFGLSTYNHHADGSGVAMATMNRPLLDTRPRQISLMDPVPGASGTGRIGCDSYILEWLDRIGVAHDVVTDHDLHAEGVAALASYRLVIACQHPEYHSWRMMDGLDAFIAQGGRFMYLGGNGYYWRAEPSEDAPDALEVRRAESGIRVWATEPGDSYHQFGGGYGGLWRRIGRPAHKLVGNGFSAQGRHLGFPYAFTDAVLDARLDFLRDGVAEARPGGKFGDRGFMGGGAAGFELDSFDVGYGSPAHGLVLAKGIVIHDDYAWVNEDMLVHRHPRKREDWSCADMVFFETASGGAVFSVGSMTFVGSLLVDGGDTTLARVTANVVRRFRDPTPFVLPDGA
jgi:N,N-dimethylformamidase